MYKKVRLGNKYINFKFENLKINIIDFHSDTFTHNVSEHSHSKFFYEFHLICGGKGKLIAENNEYLLSENCVFMTGAAIRHAQLTSDEEPLEEYCLGFEISKQKNKKDTKMSRILQNTGLWFGTDSGIFKTIFEGLADEINLKPLGCSSAINNILSLLLINLIRCYENGGAYTSDKFLVSDNQRMNKIEYRFRHSYATLTEDEMSSELNLSRRQLLRFLKKHYGKTFSQMKREARISTAKKFISDGMSIEDAAEQVGYNDIASFKKNLKLYN